MTMPHLMNCEHSDTGWCLNCVAELVAEQAQVNDTLGELLSSIDEFECSANPGVGREVQGASVRLYCDGSGDVTVGIAASTERPGTKAMLNRLFHTEISIPFDDIVGLFSIIKNFDAVRPVHPEAQ